MNDVSAPSARLMMCVSIEDSAEVHLFECNPDDTMRQLGVGAYSKFVVQLDDYEHDEDEDN
jgi:hypothetical protein